MTKVTLTTVETVNRTYEVDAPDEDAARQRLRAFWKDPDMFRDDVVSGPHGETLKNRQILGGTKRSRAADTPQPELPADTLPELPADDDLPSATESDATSEYSTSAP